MINDFGAKKYGFEIFAGGTERRAVYGMIKKSKNRRKKRNVPH